VESNYSIVVIFLTLNIREWANQIAYLAIALVGLLVIWYFNIQFMIDHGVDSEWIFFNEIYVNNASSSITNDLFTVAFVFMIWSFFEARRLEMSNWWLYMGLTVFIAIAFSLPLFLLMRERCLQQLEEEELLQTPQAASMQ